METKTDCLMCNKSFLWDESMFRFCDDCIGKAEALEKGGLPTEKLESILIEYQKNKLE